MENMRNLVLEIVANRDCEYTEIISVIVINSDCKYNNSHIVDVLKLDADVEKYKDWFLLWSYHCDSVQDHSSVGMWKNWMYILYVLPA